MPDGGAELRRTDGGADAFEVLVSLQAETRHRTSNERWDSGPGFTSHISTREVHSEMSSAYREVCALQKRDTLLVGTCKHTGRRIFRMCLFELPSRTNIVSLHGLNAIERMTEKRACGPTPSTVPTEPGQPANAETSLRSGATHRMWVPSNV